MAGFRKQATVFVLEFEDPELKGLEIKTRAPSFGEMRRYMRMFSSLQEAQDDGEKAVGMLDELAAAFTSHVIEWNLEHEDGLVWAETPATPEGLDQYETSFVMELIGAWINAVMGVRESSDLGKESPSGSRSEEELIPMDV